MEKFVPFEKLSKKRQREENAKRRGTWSGISPVTRKSKNARAYDRKKARKWSDDYSDPCFFKLEIKNEACGC